MRPRSSARRVSVADGAAGSPEASIRRPGYSAPIACATVSGTGSPTAVPEVRRRTGSVAQRSRVTPSSVATTRTTSVAAAARPTAAVSSTPHPSTAAAGATSVIRTSPAVTGTRHAADGPSVTTATDGGGSGSRVDHHQAAATTTRAGTIVAATAASVRRRRRPPGASRPSGVPSVPEVATDSRTAATSAAPEGRRDGRFSSSRSTSRSSASGTSARRRPTGGGWCRATRSMVSSGVDPWNGWRPVSISYSRVPRENRSERWSTSRPAACSGDIARLVPITTPSDVRLASERSGSTRLATPKSSTVTRPSVPTTMLSAFRSRWTRWWAWTASRARAMRPAMRAASAGARGPDSSPAAIVGPSTSSMTTYRAPASSTTSYTSATAGWRTAASARASRRRRSRRSGGGSRSGSRHLMATRRPRRSSRAAHTTPIPPAPRRPSIRYGPIRCGSTR